MAASDAPLRVAFDMTLLQSNTGGSGAYARGLLDALRQRGDVEVAVIAAPRNGGVATLTWMLSGARGRLRSSDIDVLHCPGFLLPLRPAVPMVITIHDLSLGRMPEGHPLEWRLYYRALFPVLARGASAVIVPTEATRRDVITSLGVDASRIELTPYGVDQEFFRQPGRRKAAAQEPVILFSGPPIKRKNLDAVLRVMASAPPGAALDKARLRITGATAVEFPAYRQWIRDHGLAGRVDWLGTIPARELPAAYSNADVLVYPSFIEGFGFPPLEAMAAGTPVVASNASCLPEVLGDAAVLIDPHDDSALGRALESVLTDTKLRQRLITRGDAWASRYTWRRCAERTVEVYRRALARKLALLA